MSLPAGARTYQAHFEHRLFDNGADIQPITLPYFWIGDPPAAVFVLPDAREAFIGFQRIAAGRNEVDDVVEIDPAQRRIGRGGADLVIKLVGDERLATGAAQHVLRKHVERAGAKRRGVLCIFLDRVDRYAALQNLEAV